MPFLPDDYKRIPSNSNYMKLKEGENTFRVLSSAIVGYEYWNTQNKPIRSREGWDYIPADCKQEKDGKYKINHFWAFVVWNYDEKRIQILELTQKSIMTAIKALVDNQRWGDPKMYDISITKSGAGFDTEYQVIANPPIGEPAKDIVDAYKRTVINLDALFEAGDPFNTGVTTPAEAASLMANDPGLN